MGEEGEIADTWVLDDTEFSERLSNQTKPNMIPHPYPRLHTQTLYSSNSAAIHMSWADM
jgi:hypothetical protein